MTMQFQPNTIETLLEYLKEYKDSYFLIGGQATALHFAKAGLDFRVTKDFDIVLVTEASNTRFFKSIEEMIIEGNYSECFSNGKRTAYRFAKPVSNKFPKIIEFFAEENAFPESNDKRFAKLNITVNEERISAIVLNQDLYQFAKKHVEIIDNIPVLDKYGLIVSKAVAYFKNHELYHQHKVDKTDYLKHRRDIYRLLSIMEEKKNEELPISLQITIKQYSEVLNDCSDLAKEYSFSLNNATRIYKKLFQ